MPTSLLSGLLGWVASHLVIFSLAGFLFAGLVVFEVVRLPLPQASTAVSAVESPMPAGTSAATSGGQAPVRGAPAGSGAQPSGGADEPVRPTGPRMIGGSIPVYDRAQTGPSPAAPGGLADANTFRPSAADPGMVARVLTRDDLVQEARRAFWNGDFEGAERAYMALVSAYPDDPDAFGELGNLYRSMGKPAQALDAYFEAGLRLQAAGEVDKLQQIIDLLTQEGDRRVQQLAP